MVKFVNRVKFATSSLGTADIAIGNPLSGFQGLVSAGASDGDELYYVIEEGANWEIGLGTFDEASNTLTRNPSESSNSGEKINLFGKAIVYLAAVAELLPKLKFAVTNASDGDALLYDQASNSWKNYRLTTNKLDDVDNSAQSDGSVLSYDSNSSKYKATNTLQNVTIDGGTY